MRRGIRERLKSPVLLASGAAIIMIGVLGFFEDSSIALWLSATALLLLILATLSLSVIEFPDSNIKPLVNSVSEKGKIPLRMRRSDAIWCSTIAVIAIGATVSWYQLGTVLAGGDIAPPQGLAWTHRLFDTWAWTGSNLGSPNTLMQQLPWAVLRLTIHAIGGSAALAQDLWYSGLLATAAIAIYLLLRLLDLTPIVATAAGLTYLFNGFTLSNVGLNSVYLCALSVLPLVTAVVVAVGTEKLSMRSGVVGLTIMAPLYGYIFLNPPLLLVPIAGVLIGGFTSVAKNGRASALRVGRLVLFAGLPVAAASAYWMVPALLAYRSGGNSGLLGTSSWLWTQGRATLPNAFWINTTWGWSFPEYYPFAPKYSLFPLNVLKYSYTTVALSAIPLSLIWHRSRRNRQVIQVTTLALLLILLLSTGTRLPGALLFDTLYRLPLGWILREPGRFLMVASLCLTMLFAISIEMIFGHSDHVWSQADAQQSNTRTMRLLPVDRHAKLILLVGLTLIPFYPLYFGQIAPNSRPGGMPGAHVKFPPYWTDAASYLNENKTPGCVLILPSTSYYQVGYKWNYYGNDGFITQLLSRGVVNPSSAGYDSVSSQLTVTVDHVQGDMISKSYVTVSRLMGTLGCHFILIRGDLKTGSSSGVIASAAHLRRALDGDPLAKMVFQRGDLSVFRLQYGQADLPYYDTNASPNLEILGLLPSRTVLIRGPVKSGEPFVYEPPSMERWRQVGRFLTTDFSMVPGYQYALESVKPWTLDTAIAQPHNPNESFRLSQDGKQQLAIATPLQPNIVVDGSFNRGPWQASVGDCNALPGTNYRRLVSATIVTATGAFKGRALELRAVGGSACESEVLGTASGSYLLTFEARSIRGSGGSVCVWVSQQSECAAMDHAPTLRKGWHSYSCIVSVGKLPTKIMLFLYSSSISGKPNVVDFSDVSLRKVPSYVPVIVASPRQSVGGLKVFNDGQTYSSSWQSATGTVHVLVNGLSNGWLYGFNSRRPSVNYKYSRLLRYTYALSLAIGILVILSLLAQLVMVLRRRLSAHES